MVNIWLVTMHLSGTGPFVKIEMQFSVFVVVDLQNLHPGNISEHIVSMTTVDADFSTGLKFC